MTLGDRMAEWPEKWRQEGHRAGRLEGRREGIAQRAARERALLRRLAAMRFGARVGEQVEALADGTDDWHRLAAVNELIVQADSGTGPPRPHGSNSSSLALTHDLGGFRRPYPT